MFILTYIENHLNQLCYTSPSDFYRKPNLFNTILLVTIKANRQFIELALSLSGMLARFPIWIKHCSALYSDVLFLQENRNMD